MNEYNIFMITDNNLYVTEEEYTAILSPILKHYH